MALNVYIFPFYNYYQIHFMERRLLEKLITFDEMSTALSLMNPKLNWLVGNTILPFYYNYMDLGCGC